MKEIVIETFAVCIPASVEIETVLTGRILQYPDAVIIENNIKKGNVHVVNPARTSRAESILFHKGDWEMVKCALSEGYSSVVTDDSVLLEKLKALGVSATVPAAILLAVGRKRKSGITEVRAHLDALRPFISSDEYTAYLLILEGRYPRK